MVSPLIKLARKLSKLAEVLSFLVDWSMAAMGRIEPIVSYWV